MNSKNFSKESFLFSDNREAVEALYQKFSQDPNKFPEDLQSFFSEYEAEGDQQTIVWKKFDISPNTQSSAIQGKAVKDSLRALMLIRAYRVMGHFKANLDPLQLTSSRNIKELNPETYGFTEQDYDRPIFINGVLNKEYATLNEIMQMLQANYCGDFGVEFMHIQDPEQKAWIQEHIEDPCDEKLISSQEKLTLFKHIQHAESFEKFLHVKHTGAKKFGLEGLETFIPCFQECLNISVQNGVRDVVIGMSHRGRLNVLANILQKPLRAIFSAFNGKARHIEDFEGSGDVKYHLGHSAGVSIGGKEVHLSLTANPSHLESVNPVVLGKVRSKQEIQGYTKRHEVMGILVHGDAAFSGQGVVAECFNMSELCGFGTQGTLHIVLNNQIGFTTSPVYSRSSPYCTDMAKIVQAPIFHVNADNPEAVLFVSRLAAQFRAKFSKDVVIDIIGYRRFGHNEADDPSFTQPVMYKKIKDHISVLEKYKKSLLSNNIADEEGLNKIEDAYKMKLEEAFQASQQSYEINPDWLKGGWKSIRKHEINENPLSTIGVQDLQVLGIKIFQNIPDAFLIHKRLKRIFTDKVDALQNGQGIDWALAETLAFASLLIEGHPVRLSGQDSGRGTFSQRHAILVDQKTGDRFIPLNHLDKDQSKAEIVDSLLAEFSVLGFEYGYSLTNPNALVIWEAQFGDFSNGAQPIIDQFIASSEHKWYRMSGLVMLLPHGYEGQGPEHSSARIERYLQLCAQNNLQIVNCTTPANYFHVLRRQIHQTYRKPLILFTPKSLLRHKLAVSCLQDMEKGTSFSPILMDKAPPKEVKKIILCSGKVYYDLLEARGLQKNCQALIVRIEELYPFPYISLKEELQNFTHAKVFWCQEEPSNMGAWHFLDRKIEEVLCDLKFKHTRPYYVGRPASASPATGFYQEHVEEQRKLISEALN